MELSDGVLIARAGYHDQKTEFFDYTGGPRFVGTQFAGNVQVYASTRAYIRALAEWFPRAEGAVLDLGCGDGRLSLWALERGFLPVVAVDASLDSLKRLVATARDRSYSGLIPICAAAQDNVLRPGRFDVVLCFEVLYYLSAGSDRSVALRMLRTLLSDRGRLVLSEFCRFGRLLADVVAMNVDNMRRTAFQHSRLEKFGEKSVEVSHPTPAELIADCESAGLCTTASRGVSPIAMLFQHAYNFTSYPLRPPLDDAMRAILDTLEDAASEPSSLSRNIILLLRKDE